MPVKPGLVRWFNPKSRKHEWLETHNETGVEAMDSIQSRDHSNAGFFSHISFNEAYGNWLTNKSCLRLGFGLLPTRHIPNWQCLV
jgi:hypothetical protein